MTSTRSLRVLVRAPRLATAIVVAMTLANTAQPANAVSAYLTAFETQYPAAVGSRIDSCNLCHTSSIPQLNPYGMAFQGAGHAFPPIESLDSDGDGFSNLAEIMALTFPGDAADTPPPAPSPTPTETPLSVATPTTTEQVTETVTPTPPSASPTNRPLNTPTVTPSRGAATVSPTTSAARTATSGGFPFDDDGGCTIVAPGRSSTGGGLLLLLAPALLLWASRRRL